MNGSKRLMVGPFRNPPEKKMQMSCWDRSVAVVDPQVATRNLQPRNEMNMLSDMESSQRTSHALIHVGDRDRRDLYPLLNESSSDDELDGELWPTQCTEFAVNCESSGDDDEPFIGFPDQTVNGMEINSKIPLMQTLEEVHHLKKCTVVLKRLGEQEIKEYTDKATGLGKTSPPVVDINSEHLLPNATSIYQYSSDDDGPFFGFP